MISRLQIPTSSTLVMTSSSDLWNKISMDENQVNMVIDGRSLVTWSHNMEEHLVTMVISIVR